MKSTNLFRLLLALLTAGAMVGGCNKGEASDSATDSPTPGPVATWPNYVAMDYDKPGHPSLTAEQVARIHLVLMRVKPCQRGLVRYAFPSDDADKPLLMFFVFDVPPEERGTSFTHVLGEANTYYDPKGGTMHVGPWGADDPDSDPQKRLGIQWDVDRQPCAPPAASFFTVYGGGNDPGEMRLNVLPSAAIYNVAVECLGIIGAPSQAIDESGILKDTGRDPTPQTEGLIPGILGGGSYRQSFQSCPILNAAANPTPLSPTHLYQNSYGDYLAIVAYSETPRGAEEYPAFELKWNGSMNGVSTWKPSNPREALRKCCEDALRASLQRYVELHRQ